MAVGTITHCPLKYQYIYSCDRFQQWSQWKVLRAVLAQVSKALREEGTMDEPFAVGREGGDAVRPTQHTNSVTILAIMDGHGLPLSVSAHAANPHEGTLVQLSFELYMLKANPAHLIGDRMHDGDGLDDDSRQDGVNTIAPHCSAGTLQIQDGRHLRRYERRWLAKGFFARLQWKRRLLIRREY